MGNREELADSISFLQISQNRLLFNQIITSMINSRGGLIVGNSPELRIRIFINVTLIRFGGYTKVVLLLCYAPITK